MNNGKRTARELTKRYILFIISLFFSALGVAITKKGDLGVSPISSVANVLSMQFDSMTLGNWLIIWNCALVLGQIAILRKRFQPIQLLQIPLSFLFGYFTDFSMWLVSPLQPSTYIVRLVCIFAGIVVVAFGVFLSVMADVIMNSGEAFVKSVSDVLHKPFPTIKTVFDVSCVVIAIVLSLVFFDFKIVGTREGTILAALFTGSVVSFYNRTIKIPVARLLHI